jgi:hypothetical protein
LPFFRTNNDAIITHCSAFSPHSLVHPRFPVALCSLRCQIWMPSPPCTPIPHSHRPKSFS